MKSRVRTVGVSIAMAIATTIMSACQQAPATPRPSPTVTPTPIAACPATPAAPGPQTLLQNQPAPDDLAFDNDGHLLFTDITKGTLSMLAADGSVQVLASGLRAPEGVVVQADGRILVAEQGRNRILAVDPQSHAVTLWRAFVNRTAHGGIDGIGPILPEKDANGQPSRNAGDVIVPDSPNGLVWEVTPDGKTATLIASGMTRPAGAGIDASGRIFIADEGGPVWALDPAKHRFATLPSPDDVLVGLDGHIFVNSLNDNAIHELDAQGHQLGVLRGIAQPQGIALDSADNLYYTEFSAGRIDRVVRTFILDSPLVTRVGSSRFLICPSIRRAAAFTQALSLSAGSTQRTTTLQLLQPGTDSSGALEVQTAESSITITVTGGPPGQVPLSLSQTVTLPP